MGTVKYKGEIIYTGPLAEVQLDRNWCDSMAEYYPKLYIRWVEVGEIKSTWIWVPTSAADDWTSKSEIITDVDAEHELRSIRDRKAKLLAHNKLEHGKLVRVVRGRKLPRGTEGEIFWMGSTAYGPSIGLRLIDGSKVFTSPNNVEVLSIDEIFERELLDK